MAHSDQASHLAVIREEFERLHSHIEKNPDAAELEKVQKFLPFIAPRERFDPVIFPNLPHVDNTVSGELAAMLRDFYFACHQIATSNAIPPEQTFGVDEDAKRCSLDRIHLLYPAIEVAFDEHEQRGEEG